MCTMWKLGAEKTAGAVRLWTMSGPDIAVSLFLYKLHGFCEQQTFKRVAGEAWRSWQSCLVPHRSKKSKKSPHEYPCMIALQG